MSAGRGTAGSRPSEAPGAGSAACCRPHDAAQHAHQASAHRTGHAGRQWALLKEHIDHAVQVLERDATPASSAALPGREGRLMARGLIRAGRSAGAQAATCRSHGSAAGSTRSPAIAAGRASSARPRRAVECTVMQYGQALPSDTSTATASFASLLAMPADQQATRVASASRPPCEAGRGRVQGDRRREHAEVPLDLRVDGATRPSCGARRHG